MPSAWVANLRPASFRGVPFYIQTSARASGRRQVVHEYWGRDDVELEDGGQLPLRFRITAYVLGPNWLDQRDALVEALEGYATSGVFVHPTFGRILCGVGQVTENEEEQSGGYAKFEISFVRDGATQGPLTVSDTGSALLNGLNTLEDALQGHYEEALGVTITAGPLVTLLTGILGAASASFASLPASTQSGITAGFTASVATPATTATNVLAAFSAAASNVINAQPTSTADDPVAGVLPAPAPADASGGLAGLVTSLVNVPPAPAASPSQVAAQTALLLLLQGAALLATITVYAQYDWPSANAVRAAKRQIDQLTDAAIEAAANADADDLYLAWRAVAALAAAQLLTEAEALPELTPYAVQASLPAQVLAQRLLQDGSQGDALALLNAAPHPLFMPVTGDYLVAA